MALPTDSHSQPQPDAGKAVEDTIEGCLARAAADRARAAMMDTQNGRGRLEASAPSWAARAAFLQQEADGFDSNRALAEAEWKAGEEAARFAPPDDGEAETPGSVPS